MHCGSILRMMIYICVSCCDALLLYCEFASLSLYIFKGTVAEEVALYTHCEELLRDKCVDKYYD